MILYFYLNVHLKLEMGGLAEAGPETPSMVFQRRRMMDARVVTIARTAADLTVLTAISFVAPLAAYLDVEVLHDGLTEISVTEISQSILLLLSTLLFCLEAKRRPYARGFLVLVAGFFACMFIREQDYFLDLILREGWLFLAVPTAVVSVGLAVVWRKSVLTPMAAFTRTRSCVFIVAGLVIVIVFSRIFGSGHILWAGIMGSDYKGLYKTVIQEGLELFGYGFIFFGSLLLNQEVMR